MPLARGIVCVVLCSLAAGCGSESGGGGGGASSGGSASSGASGPSAAACAAFADGIAAKMTEEACTTAIRLRIGSGEFLGYQVFCGPVTSPDEATAAAQITADSRFHFARTRSVTTSPPDDVYIFGLPYDFAAIGVVSRRTGLSLFAARMVWEESLSHIRYPQSWLPASDLGAGCVSTAARPPARSFFLVPDVGSCERPTGDRQAAALDALWNSALPDGLAKTGAILDAALICYPHVGGNSEPKNDQIVVFLDWARQG